MAKGTDAIGISLLTGNNTDRLFDESSNLILDFLKQLSNEISSNRCTANNLLELI